MPTYYKLYTWPGAFLSKTWNKSHAISLTEISFEMSSSKYWPFCLDASVLTDWDPISHTRIIWMGHHWFRYWRVVYQALNYYLLQTWHMAYYKIRWNWNQNTFVSERKTVSKKVLFWLVVIENLKITHIHIHINIPITKLQGAPYISPGLFIGCRNTDQITSLARLFFLLNLWKEYNLNCAKIGAFIDTK